MQLPDHYYAGLSGLQLPVPKYLYPQEFQTSSRLTYYASLFNSIEFNSSFYKIPMKATVARWSSAVPENFKFTFKLFKQITHTKNLIFSISDVETFVQAIDLTGIKKGCILIQFPPSFKTTDIAQLNKLLNAIKILDSQNTWKVAVEFRNKAWYNEEVYEMTDSYQYAIVKHDKPGSATPSHAPAGEFIYIRFHGPTGNYKGSYTDEFLQEYAEYIKEWLAEAKTVYVYFNNTMGNAYNNLTAPNNFVSH